jgi:isoleucyl-tRNA synthetase
MIFGKDAKVVREVKGKELVGLSYKSPFDDLPYVKKLTREEKEKFHKVIVTDSLLMPITTEEGTGLVHTSTSTGEEDHKLGKKLGLPVNPAINDKGEYLDSFGILSGKNAKKEPELIFNILDEKGFLFKVENYTHRYPACWRCKTELMWKVTDEWYIAMDSLPKKEEQKNLSNKTLRQRMIEIAKKIKWLPGFGLERELDWLTNMHDWLISKKNRFWGLALPVWECPECNYFEVIGSKEELREKSSSGWENFEGKTPHKPQIDEIKINCPKCNGVMERIEPVGNPWLDAGIVAFSTISENNKACLFEKSSEVPLYFTDKKVWQEWFPADFITESFPGQFKNWFYSLIAMSAVLENTEPAKTILGFATLLAEDGRAMHKSLGNAIEFGEGAEKIGVDVMRWLFVRQNPAENLLFGYKVADETRRRFHLKLWNVYNFFITYANLDSWKPEGIKTPSFDTEKSNPLDRWIIARLNQTIKECSEKLDNFDAYSASGEIENLVNDLSNWYIRRSRERVGLVASCEEDKNNFYKTCYQVLLNLSYLLAPFTPYLADLIYTNLTKKESVHLADWPGPVSLKHKDLDLIEEMAALREIVEKVHAVRKESKIPVRQPLKSVKVTLSLLPDFSEKLLAIAREELNIKEIIFVKGKEGIELDTRITPELAEEAKARELIRSIQEKRKDLGLSLTQKAKVISPWVPENGGLTDKILRKTMTSSLQKGRTFKVEKE